MIDVFFLQRLWAEGGGKERLWFWRKEWWEQLGVLLFLSLSVAASSSAGSDRFLWFLGRVLETVRMAGSSTPSRMEPLPAVAALCPLLLLQLLLLSLLYQQPKGPWLTNTAADVQKTCPTTERQTLLLLSPSYFNLFLSSFFLLCCVTTDIFFFTSSFTWLLNVRRLNLALDFHTCCPTRG